MKLKQITDVAASISIKSEDLECYGKHIAKVDLALLDSLADRPDGRFILVTAMTPTSYGEGKTVTTIGLTQALNAIGKKSIATLRQPSLGPVFGVKGGATGGGMSQVHPREKINLHFTGDLHAITSAHNLLAAMIDTHLFHGNELDLDPAGITWPRALDMNDRALRHAIIGIGGKLNGTPRETGFVITAASEIMAIVALASSRADLRRRLENIVVGVNRKGEFVRAAQLGAVGALMVLLNDAIAPNLVQTTDGSPAFIHAGPFANIAHGTASVVSQKLALKLADYVVNESGFAADLGAEKYFDIVSPATGIKPSAVVLIATIKALRTHGADAETPFDSSEALMRGFSNLRKHIENVRKFGAPMVVSLNLFDGDTEDEIRTVREFCAASNVECAVSDFFGRGGEGGLELAEKIAAAADGADTAKVRSIYELTDTYEEKITKLAKEIYGATDVAIEPSAKKALANFAKRGYANLPICVAKTQSSLSDDPKLLGAPSGWTMTVNEARLSAGAGFVVLLAGNMMLMPGLPKVPQAVAMDVAENGEIVGMR